MFTKQNKTNVYKTNVYKTKVYKHILFTKQNTKQKVFKTKLKFTNTLCLQNKSLQTRYFFKTKYKTESFQNKTKVYKHVMFTKQMFTTQMFTKQKFTNTFCLQNKIQKFTNTLCLQNKTNVYKTNVYKTKVYNHVMFTKQNTKQKVFKTKLKFTNTLYL